MEGADAVAGRDTTAPDYRAMVAVLEAKIARAERLIGRWYLRTIQEADLQESVEVQTATTDVAEADPPGSQVVGAQYR